MKSVTAFAAALLLLLLGCAGEPPIAPRPSAPPAATPSSAATPAIGALDQLRLDAKAIEPLVSSPLTKRFLAATTALPHTSTRALFRDAKKTRFYTSAEAEALTPDARASLTPVKADEELYYNTKYGSPLSYARPLEVLARAGVTIAPGSKILDFGYGYVGHLRLLASLGFDATGVDVDPMLRALYAEPGDQGVIVGWGGAPKGRVRLLDGRFPADAPIASAVGAGYSLILSKNVLKKGYIHPDRPADDKFLIHLGVDDATFLKAFFDALRPGGTMLVYNICPAPTPPDKPFVPWSDGRSPFSKATWEAAGFTVKEIDRDDTDAIRALGHALAWDKGEDAMDLEHDLSVLYTLVQRP